MTASTDILALVAAAITGNTDAQDRVYSPGDWPAMPENLPLLKLRILREARQSISRSGAPQFTTTATIRIVGEVQAFASEDNAGAAQAQTAIWRLKSQIDVAVINFMPLFSEIQQLASMRTDTGFNSEGSSHVAGVQIDMDFEFYEGPENFAPIASSDIDDTLLTITNYAPGAPVSADIPLT